MDAFHRFLCPLGGIAERARADAASWGVSAIAPRNVVSELSRRTCAFRFQCGKALFWVDRPHLLNKSVGWTNGVNRFSLFFTIAMLGQSRKRTEREKNLCGCLGEPNQSSCSAIEEQIKGNSAVGKWNINKAINYSREKPSGASRKRAKFLWTCWPEQSRAFSLEHDLIPFHRCVLCQKTRPKEAENRA